jgi:PhzF family phenazine biosynthesis protein
MSAGLSGRAAEAAGTVLRYTAFSADPAGGNPAGVVLDARGLSDAAMQRIAADVGYSETAFFSPRADGGFDVRYFSPRAEVSFCGHATIAASVAHAERHGAGELLLHTGVGLVRVRVDAAGLDGMPVATLASVAPRVAPLDDGDLARLLAALRWSAGELDPSLPPAIGYAGAWHPVIAVATRERLARLDYDYDALAALMAQRGWLTVNLVHREDAASFHARNPFPPGGVVEDPATGAAAAALGAYLASRHALPPDRAFVIHQGAELGRPSRLQVRVPAAAGEGVEVSGTAVPVRTASSPRR